MIPASYFYKDAFNEAWGDPHKMQAVPVETEPRGPTKGHRVGLIGLLASVLPLETKRHGRLMRHA